MKRKGVGSLVAFLVISIGSFIAVLVVVLLLVTYVPAVPLSLVHFFYG